MDIPEPEGADSAALALTLDMLEMPAEELERRFRDVWGNNADEIRSEETRVLLLVLSSSCA